MFGHLPPPVHKILSLFIRSVSAPLIHTICLSANFRTSFFEDLIFICKKRHPHRHLLSGLFLRLIPLSQSSRSFPWNVLLLLEFDRQGDRGYFILIDVVYSEVTPLIPPLVLPRSFLLLILIYFLFIIVRKIPLNGHFPLQR